MDNQLQAISLAEVENVRLRLKGDGPLTDLISNPSASDSPNSGMDPMFGEGITFILQRLASNDLLTVRRVMEHGIEMDSNTRSIIELISTELRRRGTYS